VSADDFTFKQFVVRQRRSGMKVGTDGVLLGAWSQGGGNILDIGCGTGLISLMMAQRYPNSRVLGIDIEQGACMDAEQNVAASPFAERIAIRNVALQELDAPAPLFDCIVSNPPYYADSMKSKGVERALARNADSLPFADLFRGVNALLSDDGFFSVIIPTAELDYFMAESYILGLTPCRRTDVRTVPRKPPMRSLLTFSRQPAAFTTDEQCLLNADGTRSDWYARLTETFYIR